MQAVTIESPFHTHPFVKDYIQQDSSARSFFDYGFAEEDIKKRFEEITSRTYQRKGLYSVLYTYNQKHSCSPATLEKLEKLKDPEAVAVVTGQQAGFLTGPLFTIYKAVTVLKEAEEKEQLLQRPVLPIFWIAGEDHDWEEVNHIYLPDGSGPRKITYQGFFEPGYPVAEQPVEGEAFDSWWRQAVELLPETPHTKELYDAFQKMAARAESMTDFFAEAMHWLFSGSGLILMDASDPDLRSLETSMFEQLIEQNEAVRGALEKGLKNRGASFYGRPEGFQEESAHLFCHYPHRVLLYQDDSFLFTDKTGALCFSKTFLFEEAARRPERFSTDALTRPLLQEFLLPVLSYAGGPGEINYWSVLQPLFHLFDRMVPPVVPRLEATIFPRSTQSALERENLSGEDMLRHPTGIYVDRIRQNAKTIDGTALAENLLETIQPYHDHMRSEWEKIAPSEKSYGEKNWEIIEQDIYTFADKMNRYQEEKELERIRRIQRAGGLTHPDGRPQERKYNILFFLNEYGSSFVLKLWKVLNGEYGRHHLIKL
ncbi:bacillithiol biosynthesis cysteine-adding enzyme BshC [Salibacterium sp. K-3]